MGRKSIEFVLLGILKLGMKAACTMAVVHLGVLPLARAAGIFPAASAPPITMNSLDPLLSDQTSVALETESYNSGGFSSDGRYLVFVASSNGTPLVPNPNGTSTANQEQVYRRDLQTQQVLLVSSIDGTYGGAHTWGVSSLPSLSQSGRFIAYVGTNANGPSQVYLKDMNSGSLLLVSSGDGTLATSDPSSAKSSPTVSADGRTVCYASNFSVVKCKFLGHGSTPNLSGSLTQIASSGSAADASMVISADGTKLIYYSNDPVNGQAISRKDLTNLLAPPLLVSNPNVTLGNMQASDDGNRVVWVERVYMRTGGGADFQGMIRDLGIPNSSPRIITVNAQNIPVNGDRLGIRRIGISRNGRWVVASTHRTFGSSNNLIPGVVGVLAGNDGQVYRIDTMNLGSVPVLCSARDSMAPASTMNPYGNFGVGGVDNDAPNISNDGKLCEFVASRDGNPLSTPVLGASSNTQLVTNSNANSAWNYNVYVKGLDVSAPQMVLSSTTISLIAAPRASSTETLTVTNSGTAPLVIQSLILNDSSGKFSVSGNPGTIPANGSGAIQISFTPGKGRSGVTFSASLEITSNAGNRIVILQGQRVR